MLSLTRIFLHNRHRFTSVVLELQDSLYLAGHNSSGKSTILDAIQVVLLADLNLIKFNSSAQEQSESSLMKSKDSSYIQILLSGSELYSGMSTAGSQLLASLAVQSNHKKSFPPLTDLMM
jgi:predicted ATP-dependent endonuclease of OLD family